ncbi:hypothetical protein FH972_023416 [Carpinus fangiana]|uniref:Lactoylglutathione lyase n=1 Tax=Carpinus fangiana TaxID=176857 RepID=A0A5N6KVM4_9ROSI|nr:hypothetical protein FH972_023416 [Carpinus fangiana]
MPSSHDSTVTAKRPSISARHSSGSVQTLRSPSDALSTSAQARRPSQRHVVHSRMGPRAPSFNRNLNKLAKLTAANLSDESSSPRPGNVKRNSSTAHLARNSSSSALKKTYSETSLNRAATAAATTLVKNRSSTNLPRVASSRHVHKASRPKIAHNKRSTSHTAVPQTSVKNGVRFDLDNEEADIEDDVAQAKDASSSSYEEETLTPAEEARANQVPEEDEPPTHETPTPDVAPSPSISAKDPDTDSITSRLLSRNQSSGRIASQPIVSEAAAVFKGVAHPERTAPQPIDLSTPNASGQNLVSRFISASGGSSNNTPRNSHSLGKATPEDGWSEIARRNQSMTDMHAGGHHSRSESTRSGVLTPGNQHPSRTQQKLWLERDFSNIEPQQGRPPAFLRPNRSFALGLAPGLYPGGSEARLGHHQQHRQSHDQSSIEYRRIRMFQHPAAQAIKRLQDSGVTPRTKTPTRVPSAKAGIFGGANGAPSEKGSGLSASWSSRKGVATTPTPKTPVEAGLRRKGTVIMVLKHSCGTDVQEFLVLAGCMTRLFIHLDPSGFLSLWAGRSQVSVPHVTDCIYSRLKSLSSPPDQEQSVRSETNRCDPLTCQRGDQDAASESPGFACFISDYNLCCPHRHGKAVWGFLVSVLGMKLIDKYPNPDAKFDLYFMGYDGPHAVSGGNKRSDREGLVELTHNYGTEDQADFKYHNGNDEPQGFGHICISVDNIQAACKRLEDMGIAFKKKLTDGRMKHIAFALDPDNYWVEIIGQRPLEQVQDDGFTDMGLYRMNHTMIRVKDAERSLEFYQKTMGMKLLRTVEQKEASFNLYFLGYGPTADGKETNNVNPGASREGLLELTWNYGTESKADFAYHNGNNEPQGFGHIAVSVDDIDAACARFEEQGVQWKKRLTDGRMKNIAFVLDPDNYWIEVIQNEALKN